MTSIAKVQTTDTVDYQRLRVNDIIDNLNNTSGSSVVVVNTEADLPAVTTASVNIYVIKNHTTYGGAVLACIVNSTYRFSPLKFDTNNANTYLYVDSSTIGSDVVLNRCVYLNSSGIWNLADSTDSSKQAIGIYGANNCIIFTGVYKSASLSLTTGTTYYYNSVGLLTTVETSSVAGVATSTNTLRIMLGSTNQQQVDWSQTDTSAVDYIKNKPGTVSKTANGLAPQLPNETTVTKFLRQDGTWNAPLNVSSSSAGYCPALPSDATKYLNGNGSWTVPSTVSSSSAGYCPALPSDSGKYLNGNGAWTSPITILTDEQSTGTDGMLYAVIEEY